MKRGYPPLWLCFCLLVLALLWRMIGAPVTRADWEQMGVPLWQARTLLPGRAQRVLLLWLPASQAVAEEGGGEPAQSQGKTVRVWLDGGMAETSLESYVCGVVAAEMPAAYHLEALKAQAVAARTRAVRQGGAGGCPAHPGADVCGDSGCCQGYASPEACREKWGTEAELYRERVMTAVSATRDELITYEGEPITVLYHAMSGGRTENAQAVFAQSLPYLVSVESAGEESARGFAVDAFFPFEDAAARLNQAFPGLSATAESVRRTLAVGGHTETGRVRTVILNGTELDGKAFRAALSLRSTLFSFTMNQEGLTVHQQGYGHGVGMSQVGANSMAADGADYRAILAHYYPGTMVESR